MTTWELYRHAWRSENTDMYDKIEKTITNQITKNPMIVIYKLIAEIRVAINGEVLIAATNYKL